MVNLAKSLMVALSATVAAAPFCAAQAFDLPNFSAPGIAAPGTPDFAALNFSVSLQGSAKSGYTLSIKGDDPNIGVFNTQNQTYLVNDEEIELVAHFDSTGHLLTNDDNRIDIEGSIAGWGHHQWSGSGSDGASWHKRERLLFGADLTSVGVDSTDEALGFSTSDFSGWAKQFANPKASESLWLFSVLGALEAGGGSSWDSFLAEIKDHTSLKAETFNGIASVATVPLPATLLLLLGGLVGLGGFARRRREPLVA